MSPLSFLLVLAAAAPLCAAEPPPASTAPARARQGPEPVFGAPLRLRFLVDERGRPRGELGFSVRWDTADIPELPRRAARLALDPLGTTERAAREALTGADIGVYTLRFKAAGLLPVDFLLSPLSAAAGWLTPSEFVALPDAVRPPPPPPPDPRRRLSLTPARAEIERGLRRDLRRALIEAGFDLAVPVNQKVPFAQKQAVYDSLRRAHEVLEED